MADPPPPSDPNAEGEIRRALNDLEQVLLRVPGASTVVNDVRELRALLVEHRPPRIAAIGRRGAGKSTLANALLGAGLLETGAVADTTKAAQWVELRFSDRRMRWLDTPGLRAGESPGRRDEVRRALSHEPPDVVLVTARATQADAGVDEDVAEVKWLLERQKRVGLVPPAVLAVLTRVDEMAPVTVKAPPYAGEKLANIEQAVEVFRGHLGRLGLETRSVLPVGAYMRFFKDQTVAVDWRWNLATLADQIFEALPIATHAEAARAFECSRQLRARVARRIVHACTSTAFLVGTTPIPVADLAILAPLQTVMVTGVVMMAGRQAGTRTAAEWLASVGVNVGAGFALREAARGLIKLIPGMGGVVSGVVAASGTWALGMSAIKYFIEGGSVEDARRAFETARREGAPREITGGGDDGPPGSGEQGGA